MFAIGVLAFLFVDVMEHGFEIVEEAVTGYKDGSETLVHAVGLALLLGGGFAMAALAWQCSEPECAPAQPRRRRWRGAPWN